MKEIKRMCISCRQMKNKIDLIRIVKKNNEILIDKSGKLDGRGAYICKCEACIKKAEKSKAISRAFKMQIDDEIYNQLLNFEEF